MMNVGKAIGVREQGCVVRLVVVVIFIRGAVEPAGAYLDLWVVCVSSRPVKSKKMNEWIGAENNGSREEIRFKRTF